MPPFTDFLPLADRVDEAAAVLFWGSQIVLWGAFVAALRAVVPPR